MIFKRNSNGVIYLVNQLHHYCLYTENLMIKNLELPSSYCLNMLHVLKYLCYLFDQMCYTIQNCCCCLIHFLQRNQKVALYIEQMEKEIEHYNIIYINKRDELLNQLFQSAMSNILELVKNSKKQEKKSNHSKYKNNIKGTINKLKKKKIN